VAIPGRRVAIIHEWLTTYAGSERVLREILTLYPDADLFVVVDFLAPEDRAKLYGKRANTTFIQRLPRARTKYRAYLPLMPIAIEQFDLSSYELVISNNTAVAKGVLTGPDQIHICYCNTPMRYAWDLQHQYLRGNGLNRGIKGALARILLHYLRNWDTLSASRVDIFIANSHYIARRIQRAYRRTSIIVYPPVDVEAFTLRSQKEEFYLTASRMVPYKRIDLIVEAFSMMPGRRLIVIGDGPEMERIRAIAGPNIMFMGRLSDTMLVDYLQRARAFIFAAEEDFGILPVEAQACGTPVIAYGKGGVLETVIGLDAPDRAAPTGVFFPVQSVKSLSDAVDRFEGNAASFSATACAHNAARFSVSRFRADFMAVVDVEVNNPMAGRAKL
jgi:glycosyltransferase involved in cell wall biosynthesis